MWLPNSTLGRRFHVAVVVVVVVVLYHEPTTIFVNAIDNVANDLTLFDAPSRLMIVGSIGSNQFAINEVTVMTLRRGIATANDILGTKWGTRGGDRRMVVVAMVVVVVVVVVLIIIVIMVVVVVARSSGCGDAGGAARRLVYCNVPAGEQNFID